MKLPIQINKLKNYDDLMQGFVDLMNPLAKYFSHHNTQLSYGHTGSRTSSRTASMEGLLRPLWGLVPASAGGLETPVWIKYQEAIKYGTDPDHECYWGDLNDYDQKMVEMASLGLALAMTPEKIWTPLESKVKENFSKWMNQISELDLPDNNWRFFIVMVNIGLKKVGATYNPLRMEQELNRLESFYLGDGWYSDGPTKQRGYYVSFAMHYYGLIYSKLMKEEDPIRSERFKERGKIFAKDFIYWFGEEGDALPYGRSLTYRFAQCAFWSAIAYAEVDVFSEGVVKGIILRHYRHWFKKEIFDKEGILSIGYNYENLLMAEGYNAPGSPYWAMKSFLVLALDKNHSFWLAEEEPLPQLESRVYQEHPYMVLCRENNKHFAAFTSGQYAAFEPAHMDAKYEKFVYSNVFGFSVPKGAYSLEQGAFDNMLALSEQDEYFRVRHNSEIVKIDENCIESTWSPWKDVDITTWLVPGLPWHIRIHHIASNRLLTCAEGGFAINREAKNSKILANVNQKNKSKIMINFLEDDNGCSGIIDLNGEAKTMSIQAEANTNLIHARTFIPTLITSLNPGEHWLISAVYGSMNSPLPSQTPQFSRLKSSYSNKEQIEFDGKVIIINKDTNQVIVEPIRRITNV